MEFPQKKSRVIPTNCVKQYNGAIVRTSYIGVRRERERKTDRETDGLTDGRTDKRKKEMRERERDEIDHINWERVQFFKNKLPEVLCIKIHIHTLLVCFGSSYQAIVF